MEIDVLLDVKIEDRKVAQSRSQKRTELGDVDETVRSDQYDDLKRHINKVEMYAQQIGSKRLQAEADQERLRQKKEEEKDKWDKIFKKGAYKELPKKKKKSGKQDLTSLGIRTSEGAKEETQEREKKKKGRRKQEETLDEQLDRIFQDNQVETLQRNRVDLLPRWFIVTSLLFWYLWTYRTIPGLCLFLWSFTAIFTIYEVDERDEAGRIR